MSETRFSLCLVEDDEIMGESLTERFRLEGFDCEWLRDVPSAIAALQRQGYGLVISDLRLGDGRGDDIFAWAQATLPAPPPFVFITGFGSVDHAVDLIKAGALDYITKPFDIDALVEKIALWAPAHLKRVSGSSGLGISAAMLQIEAALPRIANSASSVLITGESGVGKEHVAQALHDAYPGDGKRPFIAVNCGAIPEHLLEAELFGYEKGAFTGAARTKPGVFEQAHGGSLFFDEIGEMPLSMQVKLLRVLQERYVVRVGGEKHIPANVHVICATHRDLRQRVQDGLFREDLFYRINVLQIRVPPLRERQEDIVWLANRFLREACGETRRLHPESESLMRSYPWPGNVRELRHAIERALVMTTEPLLTPDALFGEQLVLSAVLQGRVSGLEFAHLDEYLRTCERHYILAALESQAWQITATAERLGISRKNLWEKMRKLEISADSDASRL